MGGKWIVGIACLVFAVAAQGAARWSVGQASARIGETGYLEVRFLNDGSVAAGSALIAASSVQFSTPPAGTVLPSAAGALCRKRSEALFEILLVQAPATGVDTVLCRLPLTPLQGQVRRTLRVQANPACQDASSRNVDCESLPGSFFIDGPADWSLRTLIVVPRVALPCACWREASST